MESNPVDLVSYTAPGISWTAPEKSRPWLQPPQLTDISRGNTEKPSFLLLHIKGDIFCLGTYSQQTK